MKKNILFLFLLFSKIIIACECPPVKPVSNEIFYNYDVIFSGKIDSVSLCGVQGIAKVYFTISNLYKGSVQQKVKVNFDCLSSCMMSFSKDEEWLMYLTYSRFDIMTVKLCGHSRKFFIDASQDYYQIAAQRTFEQEKEFLRTTLGIQPFAQMDGRDQQLEDFKSSNEQPSGIYKLGLLFISFTAMAIVYFVTRNKKKK